MVVWYFYPKPPTDPATADAEPAGPGPANAASDENERPTHRIV
jgi:hypothetical protein